MARAGFAPCGFLRRDEAWRDALARPRSGALRLRAVSGMESSTVGLTAAFRGCRSEAGGIARRRTTPERPWLQQRRVPRGVIVSAVAVLLRVAQEHPRRPAGEMQALQDQVRLIRVLGVDRQLRELRVGETARLRKRQERLEAQHPLDRLRPQADRGETTAAQLAL